MYHTAMLCIYAYQRGHREHSIVTPENVARDTHSPLFFLSQSSLLLIHSARSFVCLASTSRRPFLFHFSLHFFLVRFETWFYFFFIIIYIYIYIYMLLTLCLVCPLFRLLVIAPFPMLICIIVFFVILFGSFLDIHFLSFALLLPLRWNHFQ